MASPLLVGIFPFLGFFLFFSFLFGKLARKHPWGSELSALSDFREPEYSELESLFSVTTSGTYCLVTFHRLDSNSSSDTRVIAMLEFLPVAGRLGLSANEVS